MNLLLDTHILLWAAAEPEKLPSKAVAYLEQPDNSLFFSAASIWEVSLKSGLGRPDFKVEPSLLRRGLIDAGYKELRVGGEHATEVLRLPDIHKDPFDRMLLAQAMVEGFLLVTSDGILANYPGPVAIV